MRRLRALHRFVTLIALLQLLVWTASGLLFALTPDYMLRGDPVEHAHESPLPEDATLVSPLEATRRARQAGLEAPHAFELRSTPSGIYYLIQGKGGPLRLDARTGAPAPVTSAEAEESARRDMPGRPEITRTTLIDAPDIHYRNKPLPAYRVELADEHHTSVYIDTKTGAVTARRNDAARIHDVLFALHIMDYKRQKGIHHPLLVVFALLGLGTALSGAALWGARIVTRILGQRRARVRAVGSATG